MAKSYMPYPYQEYCYKRILDTPYIALWLDMGLGKTVITLSAINTLKFDRLEPIKPLVIAPKKVAEATWQQEAASWEHLQHLTFSTIMGDVRTRKAAIAADADIYIINRDNVSWLVSVCDPWPFNVVIIDEASSFKDNKTKRFKSLRSVRGSVDRLIELTGTPAPHSMIDLWAQVFLLDRGERLGKYVTHYRARYFEPDKRSATQIFSWRPRKGSVEQIREKLSDICISMKSSDYITLPDLIEDIIPVKLTESTYREYKRLEKEAVLTLEDDEEITALNAAALMNKLLQVANGAVYDGTHTAHEVHGDKVEALKELIERLHGEHVLLFYSFQHDKARIQDALSDLKLNIRFYQDAADADAWNRGEIDVLIAHPASCAYGLNLQFGGSHVVWFGLTWSLELYQQANKRLHRNGQQKPVFIHILAVQGTADEDVIASLRTKDNTQETILRALKARVESIKQRD